MSSAKHPLRGFIDSFGTLAKLRTLWNARLPRERLFLVALAAVVGSALLAQALWSAHTARARLQRQIPQLRQQAELLQRQAGEVLQLKAQPILPAAQEGQALLAAAASTARGTGLALPPGQLQLEGPRQVRLRANLPFDRWLEWVAVLQRDARLRLMYCRIDSLDDANAPGLVKVDALFALPEPS